MVARLLSCALLFTVVTLYSVIEATAENIYEIQVDFMFPVDQTVKTVTGYKLYKFGEPVVTWEGAYIFSRSVIVALDEFNPNDFTMTAVYDDGSESTHSPPYSYFYTEPPVPATPEQFERIASIFGSLLSPDVRIYTVRIRA